MITIRHADPAVDGGACASIYAPYVEETAISFEERPPTAADFSQRIARTSESFPWLVAEADGAVVGYAYGSTHRERAAYRWAADVAVYIGREHQRRGIGRALYGALLPLLRRQGIQVVCAGVTLPNDGSVRLHESLGFEPVGVYRRVGWKGGYWRDVGWWQLELTPAADARPPEPGPPARLDDS